MILAERGNSGAARAAFTGSVAIYANLEALWDIRRADARLRPFGIRRGVRGGRRRPATGWDALTPAEVRVAELVATGMSNPDIAAELYLSRKTVMTHVSHILTMLACRSRNAITRQVIERRRPTA